MEVTGQAVGSRRSACNEHFAPFPYSEDPKSESLVLLFDLSFLQNWPSDFDRPSSSSSSRAPSESESSGAYLKDLRSLVVAIT